MNSRTSNLMLGMFGLLLVIAIIYFTTRTNILREIVEVLMVLVGMISIAAISAIMKFLEGNTKPLINITFNSAQSEKVLKMLGEIPDIKPDSKPWALDSKDLLFSDPNLALAKLRIDIERDLRELAYEANCTKSMDISGINGLIRELTNKDIINGEFAMVIEDIISTVNKTIHGGKVSSDTAYSVLEIGKKIQAILNNLLYQYR